MVVHLAEVSDSIVWETTYSLAKTNSPWGMIRLRDEKRTNPVSYTIIGTLLSVLSSLFLTDVLHIRAI